MKEFFKKTQRIAQLCLVSFFCIVPYAVSDTEKTDKLIIISPHRKSIQKEFIPLFKEDYKQKYNKSIEVEWLDQGGTTDSLRFLKAKFAKNATTSGIDIFWGGGELVFDLLDREKLLTPYKLPPSLRKAIPRKLSGVRLSNTNDTWHGSSLSSFGIFYNKKLLKMKKIPEPKTWSDLTHPHYYKLISTVDPRRSGGMVVMVEIVIRSLGWEKGWRTLAAIAANTSKFTHSSSDPVKAVVAGEAAAALCIDFYAASRINKIGKDKLGYVLPTGKTVLNADPVAILKGAPNKLPAERFIAFLLRADIQKRLFLPKGNASGPKYSYLGRIAVNRESYQGHKDISVFNPYLDNIGAFQLDSDRSSRDIVVRKDLMGAIHVDTHKDLSLAWSYAVKKAGKDGDKLLKSLSTPPMSEAEFEVLTGKWSDSLFRNKKINAWLQEARIKYKKVLKSE